MLGGTEMSAEDVEFAKRSVRYLRSQGLGPSEIRSALVGELECPPEVANRLAAAA
jgi:hypothetical protein